MTPQELKNSILQLAIQGKLVEQRPEEGTGDELYKRIQAEKQKLIKDGKLKKEKPLPEIAEDEIPFEIPENWKWVHLSDLGEIVGGGTPKTGDPSLWDDDGIPWLTPADMKNIRGMYASHGERNISQTGLAKSSAQLMPKGTVLYSSRAPIGYIAIAANDICTNQGFKSLVPANTEINKYMYYCLIARTDDIKARASGTTFKEISGAGFGATLVPLPPLGEQKRIVAKIEELLPLVERYGEAWTKLEEFNKKFPDDMKKSILQQAIQGKLVEQRPEEGTGEELYQRIQAEKQKLIKDGKLKKEKPLPEITEDEIPFEIPESWKWVRLGNVCSKVVDGDHNPPTGCGTQTDYMMLSAKNINNDRLVQLNDAKYLSKEPFIKEDERTNVRKDDIFLTTVATLGRSCVYQGGYNICFQRSVTVITTLILNYFLKYVFDSPYVQNSMNREATGTAQKGFYLKQLVALPVPIPPLDEQKRIVAKIEGLLPLCEKLNK